MSVFVRTFTLPAGLTAEQRDHLQRTLAVALRKQASASAASPRIAAARTFALEERSIRFEYATAVRRTLTEALAPAGGEPPPQGGQGWPEDRLLAWAYQLCQAFLVAYPADEPPFLLHGGVTPDCILWSENDELTVTDFGVAAAYLAVAGRSADLRLEPIAPYVPREVWGRPEEFTQQADIFAVGTILYQLATEKHPYGVDSPDPDLCRFRLMTELPVEATRWRPDLSPEFTQLLHRMVSSGLADRCKSFVEVAEGIEQIAPAAIYALRSAADASRQAPQPAHEDLSRKTLALPDETALDTARLKRAASVRQKEAQQRAETAEARRKREEEQRRLAEQREREQDEHLRREAEALASARERAALRRDWLRRHTLHLVSLMVLVVGGGIALWVTTVRSRNDATFTAKAREMQSALRSVMGGGEDLRPLDSLGIPERALKSTLEHLRGAGRRADQIDLTIRPEGPMHSSATVQLASAGTELLAVQARIDTSVGAWRADPKPTDEQIKRMLSRAQDIERLNALRMLEQRLSAFQTTVNEHGTLAELPERLGYNAAELKNALAWMYLFPQQKLIRLSKPSPPESPSEPVNVEWRVLDAATQDLIAQATGQVSFRVDGPLRIETITTAEPQKHQQWCVERTTSELQDAFKTRDKPRFAKFARSDEQSVERLFGWLNQCIEPRLLFAPLSDSTVPAEWRLGIRWTEGAEVASASVPAMLTFSPLDWTLTDPDGLVRTDPPVIHNAVAFVRDTLAKINALARDALPASDETLGRGGPSLADIARALRQMNLAAPRAFTLESPKFDAATAELSFSLTPQRADDWVPQVLTFTFADGPVPDYKGPIDQKLWVGRARDPQFVEAWEQLRNAHWNIEAMERTCASLPGRVSVQQQRQLCDWVAAVRALQQLGFSPNADADWSRGLPDRIMRDMDGTAPAVFRLVTVEPGDAPAAAYVMEREVLQREYAARPQAAPLALPALEEYLAEKAPRPLVDGSPAVTGVTFDDAARFAESLGSRLVSAAEWRALHQLADRMRFDPDAGGVVEWCRSAADPADPTSAEVIGRSWLEDDSSLRNYLTSGSAPDQPARHPKARPDPTIGFRLSLPLSTSPEILTPPK